MANLRILAPADFESEVLPPISVPGNSANDVAQGFARHMASSLESQVSPPKVTLVNVQILTTKTLTSADAVSAGRDYLTVGIEANGSLVRVIGVIRFKIIANSIAATMQTREAFAAGRSIGGGLLNWMFPEPDPNNRDENGNPRQGCGSIFGWIIPLGIGGLIGTALGPVAGFIAFFISLGAAYYAVATARENKERQLNELMTIVKLALINAHGEFRYAEIPQKSVQPSKRFRHEKYDPEINHVDGNSAVSWTRE